jgi:hypothetical protein
LPDNIFNAIRPDLIYRSSNPAGFFLVILLITAAWEVLSPGRKQPHTRAARWPSNMGIAVSNTLILPLRLPTAAPAMYHLQTKIKIYSFNQIPRGYLFNAKAYR